MPLPEEEEKVLSRQKQLMSTPKGHRDESDVSLPLSQLDKEAPVDALVQLLHFIHNKQLRPKSVGT